MSTENESVEEYNRRLDNYLSERVSWMDVRKWKVIQSLLISAVIAVIGFHGGMAADYVVVSLVIVNSVLGVDYAALSDLEIVFDGDNGD